MQFDGEGARAFVMIACTVANMAIEVKTEFLNSMKRSREFTLNTLQG